MKRIAQEDLLHIYSRTEALWEDVRNKSIFVTGATGFFGRWLMESFLFANKKQSLNAKLVALTRDPSGFLQAFPFYRNEPALRFVKGDILNFDLHDACCEFIIHAATEADAKLNSEKPLQMLDTITVGTRNLLDWARTQPVQSILFTSSGAVYGKQPENVKRIEEGHSFYVDVNNPQSAYAEGKRIAELYCSIYHSRFKLPVKIARCFAFVGPYLPLDKHFAIGNFILNGLRREDIIIKGDGTPYRSYLYAADLAVWLWTILLKGQDNRPYNVGSDEDLDLAELANTICYVRGTGQVQILTAPDKGKAIERYVPSIDLAKRTLGLEVEIKLKQALENTFRFYEN